MDFKEYRLVTKLNFGEDAHKLVEVVSENSLVVRESSE
jgi:hypothetical protein